MRITSLPGAAAGPDQCRELLHPTSYPASLSRTPGKAPAATCGSPTAFYGSARCCRGLRASEAQLSSRRLGQETGWPETMAAAPPRQLTAAPAVLPPEEKAPQPGRAPSWGGHGPRGGFLRDTGNVCCSQSVLSLLPGTHTQ